MSKPDFTDCASCDVSQKSVFCGLNAEEFQTLNESKKYLNLPKGEVIFEEGSRPKGLYCIRRGKIKITQIGVDGKEQIVHLAKDADVMGYRAILSGDKYSCSAIALEDSSLCFIPRDVFVNLVETNPKLAMQMLNLFSRELKDTERKITSIAQRPVRERIAQCLLLLKEYYGFEPDGCTLNIIITREEIANISGTTRETAIRLLFELKKKQIIGLTGKKISILNPQSLLKEANVFD